MDDFWELSFLILDRFVTIAKENEVSYNTEALN